MPSLAIETHGLGKRFGARAALESIDLEVPRGTAFGFLGRNGAGKTTLVRLLLGLAEPTSGRMRLLGHDLPSQRSLALARVGAIVEEPRFHPHLTGRENLLVHAAARDQHAAGRIPDALQRVGLAARADDAVKGYSLGMRQRLGIARCLLCDPELLILDEPVNGLDPAGILEFRHLVRSLVDEGRTVLLSSHLLDEVEKTCDAAAIVDNGRVVAQGTIEALTAMSDERTIEIVAAPAVKAANVLADRAGDRACRRARGRHSRDAGPQCPARRRRGHRAAAPAAGGGHRGRARDPRPALPRRPVPVHDHPPGERVMLRLVQADLLKLQRRRGMVAVVAGLVLASVALYYAVGAILDKSTDFESAVGILTLLAAVAGAIIGATAGGQDIESGVFRDLVATGRDRGALFFARVPAAWVLTLSILAVALLGAAIVSRPGPQRTSRAARPPCWSAARSPPPSASASPRSPAAPAR